MNVPWATKSNPPHEGSSPKEVNILILGETGVGKSSWINAFYNYMQFDSLEEAEAHPLTSLIPTRFSVRDDDHNEIVVRTGTDQNEVFEDGQSATQRARFHQFHTNDDDDLTIRLIDTPGIGDVRGIEQDQVNFKNILDTIGQLNEIHGICILLRPNDAKVNVVFRFCINELLSNLHRSARDNIVFCFTHTRGTSFKPGDSFQALQSHLEKNRDINIPLEKDRIYCFDSESYRYLAAIKNNPPVKFSPEERLDFCRSWERSGSEALRLVQHIRALEPHPVKNMISLYNARNIVQKLTIPIGEVSRVVHLNKAIVNEERDKIEKSEESMKELQKHLKTIRKEIEVTKLDVPKLVCSHEECETSQGRRVCHEKCSEKGQPEDVGSFALIRCSMMSFWGKCKSCSHSYKHHLQIRFKIDHTEVEVEDPKVKKVLAQMLSEKETKLELIKAKSELLSEYETELNTICEASVKFAHFTQVNSITPYNDGIEAYLNYLILVERNKPSDSKRSTLTSLEASLAKYKAEKETLAKAMSKVGGERKTISPEEIVQLVNELMALKHTGHTLKETLDFMIRSSEFVHQCTVVHRPIPQAKPRTRAASPTPKPPPPRMPKGLVAEMRNKFQN